MPARPANPGQGDFVVEAAFPGFRIRERTGEKDWREIAKEPDRLKALSLASDLAAQAGTRAWTYELDNQFLEIAPTRS